MGALDAIKQPFLGLTGTERVAGQNKAAQIQRTQFVPAETGGYNMFAGVPEETPPVIAGGTHINGLGVAGEKFDSYKYFG